MAVNHAVSFSMACDDPRFMIPAARTAHFDLQHAKKGAARRHPCHKHQFDISASTQQHLLSVQHLSACSTSTASHLKIARIVPALRQGIKNNPLDPVQKHPASPASPPLQPGSCVFGLISRQRNDRHSAARTAYQSGEDTIDYLCGCEKLHQRSRGGGKSPQEW